MKYSQGLIVISKYDRQDWFVPVDRDSTLGHRNRRQKKGAVNRLGFAVKYCKKCNLSWETKVFNGKRTLFQYDDFPTYGLKKEICPCCHQDK